MRQSSQATDCMALQVPQMVQYHFTCDFTRKEPVFAAGLARPGLPARGLRPDPHRPQARECDAAPRAAPAPRPRSRIRRRRAGGTPGRPLAGPSWRGGASAGGGVSSSAQPRSCSAGDGHCGAQDTAALVRWCQDHLYSAPTLLDSNASPSKPDPQVVPMHARTHAPSSQT